MLVRRNFKTMCSPFISREEVTEVDFKEEIITKTPLTKNKVKNQNAETFTLYDR